MCSSPTRAPFNAGERRTCSSSSARDPSPGYRLPPPRTLFPAARRACASSSHFALEYLQRRERTAFARLRCVCLLGGTSYYYTILHSTLRNVPSLAAMRCPRSRCAAVHNITCGRRAFALEAVGAARHSRLFQSRTGAVESAAQPSRGARWRGRLRCSWGTPLLGRPDAVA